MPTVQTGSGPVDAADARALRDDGAGGEQIQQMLAADPVRRPS